MKDKKPEPNRAGIGVAQYLDFYLRSQASTRAKYKAYYDAAYRKALREAVK